MRFRKLRIAWSAMWGLLTAIFIIFWIDGNWQMTAVRGTVAGHVLGMEAAIGRLTIWHIGPSARPPATPWTIIRGPMTEPVRRVAVDVGSRMHHFAGVHWLFSGSVWKVAMSFWLLAVLGLAVSSLPWLGEIRKWFRPSSASKTY